MTNKPMFSVEQELLQSALNAVEYLALRGDDIGLSNEPVAKELRALLDKPAECLCKRYGKDNPHWQCPVHAEPAAQHQGEPVAVVIEETHNYGGYLVFGGGNTGVQRPRPVVERKAHLLDRALPAGTQLYAEQTAPVAVVMPDDWEDQLFAEMSRRFDLRKQIDDDHMVYDDTQIGVEFARDWIKARLNGVKP